MCQRLQRPSEAQPAAPLQRPAASGPIPYSGSPSPRAPRARRRAPAPAHRLSATCASAWCTSVCRYSTLRLYTQAEPWMTSAAAGGARSPQCPSSLLFLYTRRSILCTGLHYSSLIRGAEARSGCKAAARWPSEQRRTVLGQCIPRQSALAAHTARCQATQGHAPRAPLVHTGKAAQALQGRAGRSGGAARAARNAVARPGAPSAKFSVAPPSKLNVMCSSSSCAHVPQPGGPACPLHATSTFAQEQGWPRARRTRYSSSSLAMLISQLAAMSFMGCSRCANLQSSARSADAMARAASRAVLVRRCGGEVRTALCVYDKLVGLCESISNGNRAANLACSRSSWRSQDSFAALLA
jgi:hypothetical protein